MTVTKCCYCLFSVVIYFKLGSSLSPVTMTGSTFHQEVTVLPWRKVYIFRRLSASDFVKQAALAAFGAVALLCFNESHFPQVVECTVDGGLGQLQFCRYSGNGWPTFTVFIGSVRKVGIDGYRTVRKLHAV